MTLYRLLDLRGTLCHYCHVGRCGLVFLNRLSRSASSPGQPQVTANLSELEEVYGSRGYLDEAKLPYALISLPCPEYNDGFARDTN